MVTGRVTTVLVGGVLLTHSLAGLLTNKLASVAVMGVDNVAVHPLEAVPMTEYIVVPVGGTTMI
jgi:hypothetical protein